MADVIEMDFAPKATKQSMDDMKKEFGKASSGVVPKSQAMQRADAASRVEISDAVSKAAQLAAVAGFTAAGFMSGGPLGAIAGAFAGHTAAGAIDTTQKVYAADGAVDKSKAAASSAFDFFAPKTALAIKGFKLLFDGIAKGVDYAEAKVKYVGKTFMGWFNELEEYGSTLAKYVGKYNPAAVDRFNLALDDFNAILGYIMEPALEQVTKLIRNMADGLLYLAPVLRKLFDIFAIWPIKIGTWLGSLALGKLGDKGSSTGFSASTWHTTDPGSLGTEFIKAALASSKTYDQRIAEATEKTAENTSWMSDYKPGIVVSSLFPNVTGLWNAATMPRRPEAT